MPHDLSAKILSEARKQLKEDDELQPTKDDANKRYVDEQYGQYGNSLVYVISVSELQKQILIMKRIFQIMMIMKIR